ncbi:MAG TPA: RluA family pseudouridine synthase [Sphingomicrobium sp.]|nr:RluA family pseudouridine synthase [Sphingomicrobium sp.]
MDQSGGGDLADRVLFVDAEAIVIDKPAGLPVDAPRSGGDSIAGRLDELKFGFHRPPVPVHRLDRDTSGCLLLARSPKARARFGAAFERGEVEKTYIAVLEGNLSGEGIIDLPLAKISSAEQGWRVVVDEKGKAARTRWRAGATRDGRTLVEFRPETGRTHQIRAHALYGLEASIVGDPVYGQSGKGLLLHAIRLFVPREKKPPIDVTAPLPQRFGEWRDEA